MKETHLFQFKLSMIFNLSVVDNLVSYGYRLTGNKFSVEFHGSKGYLSHVTISCEGRQEANNRLFLTDLKANADMLVNVFHSEKKGVRICTGDQEPRGPIPYTNS